ncbi:hypothetical protein [Vibrio ezurae]|uniref:Uncharacterized protein n=1 Tax=Vibrio ezurae NBRC 102218 TaxID=1219080 RepID=U3ALR8_9VIBR|nr:hypothetical protein [Vibrio ezurae]GAD80831.1 hypothetical protein VEZ01S_44_00340 [Vibrio ezurae NBRC 102218]
MSSKITSMVWSLKLVVGESKLVLLALAELADRNGNFQTTYAELQSLTGMSNGAINTILHHLSSNQSKLVNLNNHRTYNHSDNLSGSLHLDNNLMISQQSAPVLPDLYAQAQTQRENFHKRPQKSRLNRGQRSQITPLDKSAKEKTYHIWQVHEAEIHDWAEGLLFKMGVGGNTEIWQSLVQDVHKSGEEIFTLSQLINRLHQKINFYKQSRLANTGNNSFSRPAKQSAMSEFEEKFKDYYPSDEFDG